MCKTMDSECEATAQHYAALARQPGWWHYTRQQVRELEADDSGAFKGLYARVRALLGEFRPNKEEANWEWI